MAGNPLDWACPHFGCDAQPGHKCRDRVDLGSSWIELDAFHAERIAMAGGDPGAGPGYEPTHADFRKAMLEDPDIPF